jgi:GNAT superfamily N-acetyltransferase
MTAEKEAVAIVGFEERHAAAFARLNREWLEQYALLEDADRKYLEQPRESILAKGGEIFFALQGGEVIGTCAAIPRGTGTVELAKLAVHASARGLGIGRRLSEAAIGWARERGALKVILVSSTKLQAALRLYERLGFQNTDPPAQPDYATADVYMEIAL